jgi:hypothetical protein
VGSKPQAVGNWEKRFGEVDGGGAAECVALGDAVHRAPPPVVHAVLRHRAVDPPDPALVPVPSAVIASMGQNTIPAARKKENR